MADHRWIDDAAELAALCERLLAEPAYALDTEFHRERTYFPQLALMQIAFPGTVVLIDTLAVDIAPFCAVLESDALCVMHAADQDLEILQLRCGRTPARLADTQVSGRFLGFGTASLDTLLRSVLGLRLPKADQLTDWTRRPLGTAQREYAAADVDHLLELDDALAKRLEEQGRTDWAAEELEEIRTKSRLPRDPATAWWRLKGSRKLRGPSRGVAQEVCAWREETAMETDRPPRFVLPDLALLGIAQRPPRDTGELRSVRGLDGRHLRQGADRSIMQAIERGRELGPDELRLPPVNESERAGKPVVSLALAWIGQVAADLDLDPTLLATRDDVNDLIVGSRDGRLSHGWRFRLAGETVLALAAGEVALAVDADGGLRLVDT